MNSLILCEGKSDAIIISYYLQRKCGFVRCEKSPYESLDFKKLQDNQYVSWYKAGKDFLMIFAVGGKDNFKYVLDKYILEIIKEYPRNESFQKIAIIGDNDNAKNVIEEQKEWFQGIIKNIFENQWAKNSFINSFGVKTNVQILSLLIPPDKHGALENVLLDAISEDENDKIIVEKSKGFVERIRNDAQKYILNDRLALKAKLSTVFAVMSPEKTFHLLDEIMQSVKWEKYQTVEECFSEMCKIKR